MFGHGGSATVFGMGQGQMSKTDIFSKQDVDNDIFQKKCTTAEEKYRVLEARDKILRGRLPKGKVRVEFATKLSGTCPDMCPEKERYMRQYQRQLTCFEISSGFGVDILVDHKKAVKAYSRSSADQEEPLPHDLRPDSTLEMTMNYLLHNIIPMANDNPDNLGDWYTFLWDRTRSIRKDITQQQLTNLRVVGLMEKCTRFHIHCSSRLCELDVHLFDPKLNDENLMKCLQSLEHLYDDLRRCDIKCPNEPEFRAYQILMNLNEGDIQWSVQQRPQWILQSWEVQTAVKLHHYVFSRNFVGFFRVVKSLPYMFSCILHRYFYQVRFGALMAMCRSSAGKKVDIQLVFSQVQRMLGYGAEEPSFDFENFCVSHGLPVDLENDRIHYHRIRFVRPAFKIVNREFSLIESKQTTSIAEAINGGPLAENPSLTYEPHSSFTEEGYLISGLVLPQEVSVPTVIPVSTLTQQNPMFKWFPSAGMPCSAVFEPQKPPSPSPEQIQFQKMQAIESVCIRTLEELVGNLLRQQVELVLRDAIQSHRAEMEMQKRLRIKEEIRSNMAEDAMEKILKKTLPRLVSEITGNEIQYHYTVRRLCDSSATKFLERCLPPIVETLCKQSLISARRERDKLIKKLTEIFQRIKIRFVFRQWQHFTQLKVQKRKQKEDQIIQDMLNFPVCYPVGKPTQEVLQKLRGNGTSPNIIKTSPITNKLVDKYEKIETLAESFITNVTNYVTEIHNKSLDSTFVTLEQTPLRSPHQEYYRHVWKRQWSPLNEEDANNSSVAKYPRIGECNSNSTSLRFPSPPATVYTTQQRSEAQDLLDQIRKFTEDAKKEKENLDSTSKISNEIMDELSSVSRLLNCNVP